VLVIGRSAAPSFHFERWWKGRWGKFMEIAQHFAIKNTCATKRRKKKEDRRKKKEETWSAFTLHPIQRTFLHKQHSSQHSSHTSLQLVVLIQFVPCPIVNHGRHLFIMHIVFHMTGGFSIRAVG
jgi:hypothetical protein